MEKDLKSHVIQTRQVRCRSVSCLFNPLQVGEWRKGTEKDLDNVLQIQSIYTNVSKGQLAGTADLEAAFGSSDTMKIIIQILEKGELQIGEKERNAVWEI